jgi:hypothetical protein
MERYDFKGNLVERVRRVVKDDRLLAPFAGAAGRSWVVRPFRADWDPGAGSLDTLTITTLDTMEFRVSTNFDARNRPWRMTYPQDVEGNRKQLRRRFDRGGSVTSVALDGAAFARQIAYNPRGQRVLIVYGNGIMARHVFDPDTFRLIRQRAERFRTPNPHDYCPNGGLLQDLFYGYDLIGNPLTIIDRTPGSGVLNNQDALTVTDATLAGLLAGGNALLRRFTYDPLYRLIRATGRIAKAIIAPRPWTDDPRAGFNSGSHATPNQDNAPNLTTNYVETYAYDPAGNMLWLRQQADGSAWVRHFGMGGLNGASWDASWQAHLNAPGGWLSPPGNTLTHVGDNSPGSAQTHFFDPNGNLIRELADRNSEWDYADRLRTFRVQIVGNEPSSYTQYLYAADGTRVKKLVRKAGGNYDVVVEIDGLFELHRQNQSGATLQNNRVHVTV